ncbi:MAG: ATP-grasp domain-containing protein [Microthrixaceae bacterium]
MRGGRADHRPRERRPRRAAGPRGRGRRGPTRCGHPLLLRQGPPAQGVLGGGPAGARLRGARPATDRERALATASEFARAHSGGLVAKASRGGYDGRAVWRLSGRELEGFVAPWEGAPLVLEPLLELSCELAVLVARRPSGEVRTWPVLETVQVDGMCDEVLFPAPVDADVAGRAREVAARVAEHTGAVGVLAVELFVTPGGEVLVNEIAPRVHNSGHLTIEGSCTSQFEQHLRAVLDWPLGPTQMLFPSAVMANVVGQGSTDPRTRQHLALAAVPGAHVHLYGKTPRDRRKIGHVTVVGEDLASARREAARASELLAGPRDDVAMGTGS